MSTAGSVFSLPLRRLTGDHSYHKYVTCAGFVSIPLIIFYSFLLYKVLHSICRVSLCQNIRCFCCEAESSEEFTLSQIESSILDELSTDRFNISYQEGGDNLITMNGVSY